MSHVFVKGQALRQDWEVVTHLYGEQVRANILERLLLREFRELSETGKILPSGWYPVAWANEFLRAAQAELPQVMDLPERLARATVERDMQGMYGFLTRFLSPEFCVRQAPRVLGTYHKGLHVDAKMAGPHLAELTFTECQGVSRALWRSMSSGAGRIVEQAGGRDVKFRILQGGYERDERTVIEFSWEE